MSNKDKWRTFPCKECLLKKMCKIRCFNWPQNVIDGPSDKIKVHIKENNLEHICLSCGHNPASDFGIIQWYCKNCRLDAISNS